MVVYAAACVKRSVDNSMTMTESTYLLDSNLVHFSKEGRDQASRDHFVKVVSSTFYAESSSVYLFLKHITTRQEAIDSFCLRVDTKRASADSVFSVRVMMMIDWFMEGET